VDQVNRGLGFARKAFALTLRDTVELLEGVSQVDDGLQSVETGGSWVSGQAAVYLPGQAMGIAESGSRLISRDTRLVSMAHGTPAVVGQRVRWQSRLYRIVELIQGHRAADMELRFLIEPEGG
jgi:hypothetical protein